MVTFALDVPTIALLTAMVMVFGAGAMIFLAYGHPTERGLYDLATGSTLIAVGMLFYPFQNTLPMWLSATLPNFLYVAGPAFFWFGFRQLFRRPVLRRPALIWAATIVPIHLYFSYVDYNSDVRVVVYTVYHGSMMVLTARELFRRSDEAWAGPRLVIAWGVVLHTAYTVVRGVIAATVGAGDAVKTPGILHGLAFLDAILINMSITFGCALLTSQRLQAHLNRVARTDDLTGALNRRALVEAAAPEAHRSQRHGTGMAVLILDIDHFKAVNDRFGHVAGDEVLRRFVVCIRDALRAEDLLGRMGGEEFCAVLVDAASRQIEQVGERLRQSIADLPIPWDKTTIRITASIGIAILGVDADNFDDLYKRADERLYQAKAAGRNQVIGPPRPA